MLCRQLGLLDLRVGEVDGIDVHDEVLAWASLPALRPAPFELESPSQPKNLNRIQQGTSYLTQKNPGILVFVAPQKLFGGMCMSPASNAEEAVAFVVARGTLGILCQILSKGSTYALGRGLNNHRAEVVTDCLRAPPK